MRQGKRIHMGVMPRHLLMLHASGMPWRELVSPWPEGATEAEVEAQVKEDIASGKVYTFGECDNRKPDGSCAGHPIEDENPLP